MVGSGGPSKPEETLNTQSYDQRPDTADSISEHPIQQQPSGEQQSQGQPGQDAQKQQGASRPTTRQGPQHKLQAKITGLERTGRKDPILRFDVHVHMPVSARLLAF